MTEKLFLTIKEAARTLSLSRSMVYRLLRTGELRGVKIGHARRIHVASIQAFANQLAQKAGEA